MMFLELAECQALYCISGKLACVRLDQLESASASTGKKQESTFVVPEALVL